MDVIEGLAPVEDLQVQVERTAMGLVGVTAGRCELSIVVVLYLRPPGLVDTGTHVEGKLEILQEAELGKAGRVDGVALSVVDVEGRLLDCIGLVVDRTGNACDGTFTPVVHGKSVFVLHLVSLCIPDVEGIDGGNTECIREEVSGRTVVTLVRVTVVVVEVGVTEVRADLEPALGLVFSLKSCSVALHVGAGDDTLVVQVTE